ncbi:hypothetical protein NIES30_09750 [Phormidium tenue NIES-30]|uniref:Uncharacterized protein n=1 Tax=Phormidium tenue NIES-30 TaxID=549789 RepID=A0A1U7J5X1_9CYAN|nr:hypothetical protein NIES30_09750 [Phormidium tenue NIES-30]
MDAKSFFFRSSFVLYCFNEFQERFRPSAHAAFNSQILSTAVALKDSLKRLLSRFRWLALLVTPALGTGALLLPTPGQGVAAAVKATVTTRQFSIDYPDHWIVTSNSNDYVIIYNQPLT